MTELIITYLYVAGWLFLKVRDVDAGESLLDDALFAVGWPLISLWDMAELAWRKINA